MAIIRSEPHDSDVDHAAAASSRTWDDVIYRDDRAPRGRRLPRAHTLTRAQPEDGTSMRGHDGGCCGSRPRPRRPAARLRLRPNPRSRAVATALVASGHEPSHQDRAIRTDRRLRDGRIMLDGNAVAGLLQEVFETEMTTATERAPSAGRCSSAPSTSSAAPVSCSAARPAQRPRQDRQERRNVRRLDGYPRWREIRTVSGRAGESSLSRCSCRSALPDTWHGRRPPSPRRRSASHFSRVSSSPA
jgi:hypothetical protein